MVPVASIVPLASTNIEKTRSIASGVDRRLMARDASIPQRVSIAMAPAQTSASGADRPQLVPDASTAPPEDMRSKHKEEMICKEQ